MDNMFLLYTWEIYNQLICTRMSQTRGIGYRHTDEWFLDSF